MINRYSDRQVIINKSENIINKLRERGVNIIKQYNTPNFIYPNYIEYSSLSIVNHVWKTGDRYHKLADEYYGDGKNWWIIAKFNQKPTEAHLQIGDIIQIPTPLDLILVYMRG